MLTGEQISAIDLRFQSGNGVPVERAFITRAEWDALLQLARAVNESPRGTLTMDAHPWLTVDDADVPAEWEGQTVALVPVPVKEGANG